MTMAEYVLRLRERVGGEELLQIPSVAIALRDANGRVILARHSEGDGGHDWNPPARPG